MTSTALRVKELLKEFGWTTKILAEKTGMSESYLTHIKNGTRRWNEDALRKIAEAFEKKPVDLLYHRFGSSETQRAHHAEASSEFRIAQQQFASKVVMVPLLNQIPEKADLAVYTEIQMLTDSVSDCVPFYRGDIVDPLIFALLVENNMLAPRFFKGDSLLISPGTPVVSGDCAVVEYKYDKVIRGIMVVTYVEGLVVLEYPNHKLPPLAMSRAENYVKIIGKVVARYQKI